MRSKGTKGAARPRSKQKKLKTMKSQWTEAEEWPLPQLPRWLKSSRTEASGGGPVNGPRALDPGLSPAHHVANIG